MTWAVVVLFAHIVAACIWIGGNVALAVVMPVFRSQRELLGVAARRFAKVAWIAFGVLVVTGILNVSNAGISWFHLFDSSQGKELTVKLGFVFLSGASAAVHSFIQGPRQRARRQGRPVSRATRVLGGVTLLSALMAALYGVVIAQGS